MLKITRFLVTAFVALVAAIPVVPAVAAPAGWQSVNVTLQSEEQQSMLLISGELPADAKLPAEAELAVPAGTQLQWIGEILGGDPSKDPKLAYTKTSSSGMDVYRFTLSKARVAQVEGTVPNVNSFDGTNYVTAFKWTAWQAVPQVNLSQRIPNASQIVQAMAGASVQPGPTGYSYYTKTFESPKAGDVLDLSFSYALPAVGTTNSGTTAGSSSGTIVPIFITIVLVGGFGLLFLNIQKKMAARTALNAPAVPKSRKQVAVNSHAKPPSKKRKSQPEPAVEPAPTKRVKPVIPILAVVAVFVIGFSIAGAKGSSAVVTDSKITRSFGAASACQSASLPIAANQGVDLAQQGEQLLKAFEGMDGVGEVTLDVTQSQIDMAWCESSQSEESMRQALSATGLVTLGQAVSSAASAATTATIDASGKKQTVTVDTSSGSFSPSQILLKAGVPAELSFGQAAGCLSEVVIADLGINQDLTKGAVTVKLPAIDAGTYAFACAMGHQSGQLVVQ